MADVFRRAPSGRLQTGNLIRTPLGSDAAPAIANGFFEAATGFVTHTTDGALTGQGATTAGSAARIAVPVAHSTSGALTGPGTTTAGSSARTRVHATSGVLNGVNAIVVVGSATRFRAHATSGSLAGTNPKLLGSAARLPLLPDPADVRAGLVYGPGGALTGTLAATNGGTVLIRRR